MTLLAPVSGLHPEVIRSLALLHGIYSVEEAYYHIISDPKRFAQSLGSYQEMHSVLSLLENSMPPHVVARMKKSVGAHGKGVVIEH